MPTSEPDLLARLFATIQSRKGADPETSYTALLLQRGPEAAAKKLGEEAVETVIAALGGDRAAIAAESADLLYHLLVLWAATGVEPEAVWSELARREGRSGIAEKAARGKTGETMMAYDSSNVFARILRGEIPCKKIHENAHALAFHDIRPQTKVHALVIPKGAYVGVADFAAAASAAEIEGFVRAIGETARLLGVTADGFRVLANTGADARQEVPHLHVHIFGGQPLGRMIKPE